MRTKIHLEKAQTIYQGFDSPLSNRPIVNCIHKNSKLHLNDNLWVSSNELVRVCVCLDPLDCRFLSTHTFFIIILFSSSQMEKKNFVRAFADKWIQFLFSSSLPLILRFSLILCAFACVMWMYCTISYQPLCISLNSTIIVTTIYAYYIRIMCTHTHTLSALLLCLRACERAYAQSTCHIIIIL